MFWFIILFHLIVGIILMKANFSKTLVFWGFFAALFLPSIINLVINTSIVFDMYNLLKTTGWSLLRLSVFGLYAIPLFIVAAGLALYLIENLFSSFPVPCFKWRWLKISGLRLVNAGCGISAGVWLTSYFLNGR